MSTRAGASAILEAAGEDGVEAVIEWVLPTGAAGAVIVSAWLVDAKQSVIENMAPVLTTIFTPLFAAMLAGSAVTYAVSDSSSTGFRPANVLTGRA
jgi:hypothetical protein